MGRAKAKGRKAESVYIAVALPVFGQNKKKTSSRSSEIRYKFSCWVTTSKIYSINYAPVMTMKDWSN
jgi:hypothetical protein